LGVGGGEPIILALCKEDRTEERRCRQGVGTQKGGWGKCLDCGKPVGKDGLVSVMEKEKGGLEEGDSVLAGGWLRDERERG